MFEVTPVAASGDSPGLACRSAAVGPILDNPLITVMNGNEIYSAISAADEVDQLTMRIATVNTGVVIDVTSYEGNFLDQSVCGTIITGSHTHGTPCNTPCFRCHEHDYAAGPINHGFTDGLGSNNGDENDKLISNTFLLKSDGTLVSSRDDACPGCDAPGIWHNPGSTGNDNASTRNRNNPYMDLTGGCSDPQFKSEVTCVAAYCDDDNIRDQALCVNGFCYDYSNYTETDCVNAGKVWSTAGVCIESLYTDQTSCEAASNGWYPSSVWNAGSTWNNSPLDAGDYMFAIGAYPLSQTEASAGSNAVDNWGWSSWANNNYKIIFTFNP